MPRRNISPRRFCNKASNGVLRYLLPGAINENGGGELWELNFSPFHLREDGKLTHAKPSHPKKPEQYGPPPPPRRSNAETRARINQKVFITQGGGQGGGDRVIQKVNGLKQGESLIWVRNYVFIVIVS